MKEQILKILNDYAGNVDSVFDDSKCRVTFLNVITKSQFDFIAEKLNETFSTELNQVKTELQELKAKISREGIVFERDN